MSKRWKASKYEVKKQASVNRAKENKIDGQSTRANKRRYLT